MAAFIVTAGKQRQLFLMLQSCLKTNGFQFGADLIARRKSDRGVRFKYGAGSDDAGASIDAPKWKLLNMNVVFDCDGTLVSSHQGLLQILQTLISEEKGRKVSMSEIYAGYDADMLRCAKNFGLDLSDPSRLLKRWGELSGQSARATVYSGIPEVLQTLEDAGHRLVVWTGRDRASTLEILRAAGILRYFEELVCADDTTPRPHHAGLAKLLDGEKKSQCLHIGDSYTDIQGANSYGIDSVGALWAEHASKEDFREYIPTYWCEKPSELLKVIEAKNV